MKINLPTLDINPDKIKDLDEAKKAINQLLNAFEQLAALVHKLAEENERLKQENDRLRKQSKKPLFKIKESKTDDYSASKMLEQNLKKWKKSVKKKKIKIDQELQLSETGKCTCGCKKFKALRTWGKTVQDIEIKRNNIRYLGKDKKCLSCGKIHKSTIPEEIKGKEFGSNLTTWASLLKHDCRFSELLIHKFLTTLEIIISKGQINNIIMENSQKLEEPYLSLKTLGIRKSSYLHSDPTGFKRRIMRKVKKEKEYEIIRQHLHFVGHEFLSLFKITRRYNSKSLNNKVLGKKARKKLYISDDHGANGQRLIIDKKQLGWIHEIRHFLKLKPYLKVNKERLSKIINQLWELYHQAKAYNKSPTKKKKNNLSNQFETITNQKTNYEALDKRLILTRRKKKRLLLFLNYPGLPIQNNLAERDLRPAVIIRKLTGGTKSKKGDRSFERHMSIIQTIRKQGLNVFDTLHGLLTNQINPSVLTVKTTPKLKRFT